ncbi:MAG: hypothetical protein NVS1B13_22440 [Flavisolibacter sp.]
MEIVSKSSLKWYTKEHMVESMVHYLKRQGFKVYKENFSLVYGDSILFAITEGYKEIIQIKGFAEQPFPLSQSHSLLQQESHHLGREMEQSLLSLSKNYTNKVLPVCFCLPQLESYRDLLMRVSHDFSSSNLSMKIYFVDKQGAVSTHDLNNFKA